MPHNSRSWCQSAELRASREHSRPSTIPARPSDTSATRCWNPSRSAELAPEWPWSMSITLIWSSVQPSAMARLRRSYWRCADSALWMTCLRVDWRAYHRAGLPRRGAVTLDAAVSVNTGMLLPAEHGGHGVGCCGRGRSGWVYVPASTTAARTLTSSAEIAAETAAAAAGAVAGGGGG